MVQIYGNRQRLICVLRTKYGVDPYHHHFLFAWYRLLG